MKKKLIIVSFLLSQEGHWFNELLGYKYASSDVPEISVRILVPRDSDPSLAASLSAERVLASNLVQILNIPSQKAVDRLARFYEAAVQDLQTLWGAIEAHGPTEKDILFFTSAMPIVIAGVGLWLAQKPVEQRPAVFFRLSGQEVLDEEAGQSVSTSLFFRVACADLRTRLGQERVFLLAESTGVARAAERIGGRRTFPTPVPKYIADVTAAALARSRPSVRVHLNSRSGRFLDRIAEIIRRVTAANPAVEFIVKTSGLAPAPRLLIESNLAQIAQVLPAMEDTADYFANLSKSTIVLLAYEYQRYAKCSSGVFVEAVSLGKPVVVPGGTWMAQQIMANRGAGVIFDEQSAKGVAAALIAALRDIDELDRVARTIASLVRRENSSLSYIDEMIKLSRTKPDMERHCRIDEEIDFSDSCDSRCFMREGWGETEDWGVWSVSRTAKLSFKFISERPRLLRALVKPYLTPTHRQVDVSVSTAQRDIALWRFSLDDPYADETRWCEAAIPSSDALDSLDVAFTVDAPISPHAEGFSADMRTLGLGLIKLSLSTDRETVKPVAC